MNGFTRTAAPVALALCLAASAATAAPIQGTSMIAASTTIPLFYGDIRQISDGDTSNMNGWAGANFTLGTIKLDLLGTFDIDSFSLWNDVNILREGVGDFQLHFYDAADQLVTDSAVYTAPISQAAAGVYNFATVRGVSRVDLEVLSLLTGGVCCRIEIREVAFNGNASVTNAVPEPMSAALAGLGLVLMGASGRLLRRPA